MRSYQLYLIEDEFASHYFGRERMFYQLFLEYSQANGELKSILAKQVGFVTKSIPVLRIHQLLHQQLSKVKGFKLEDGVYIFENKSNNSSATLKVHDRWLELDSRGPVDAETVFFEILRKCESSFLAIDLDSTKYGWLKPIKERKYI
ncbi:sporulation inhibitor of replication protein SirA [Mesobacillus subterraneus]|uniref:Sporulation inhibitor of replication protein SirA n=1 Tax=Mesobacillus subterraneus TaxID=285983 RepID=A0A427TWH0_9BACI|nr:sporulation inhibitor of replication protein SirA [Mesobacillus subterraneus]RSD28813.1 sporulation inhibitor of replication protein SirA [Mesobacillus subterraneus]